MSKAQSFRRNFIPFFSAGSLESPMALSPAQSYFQPTSTYFHQHCQWFFDPPPSRQLVLDISTLQKGGGWKTHADLHTNLLYIFNSKYGQKTTLLLFLSKLSIKNRSKNITAVIQFSVIHAPNKLGKKQPLKPTTPLFRPWGNRPCESLPSILLLLRGEGGFDKY